MNNPKGSLWHKWDLHIHTPESLIHNYTGNAPWDRFLNELEALPPEFKVIGINDYIFLDGYKRILKERQKGRLKNIELFLPVIEIRLDKFGGSDSHISRVNYHIIFSDDLFPELIEQQFLNALSSKYILSPQYDNFKKSGWAALPTRDSLEDLGKMIIGSVPLSERNKFKKPLIEGFNNLCFSFEAVQEVLKSHYFQEKVVTAVGKTEWASIKWNDHSIAEKKNIINKANFVFISAATPEEWNIAKKRLTDSGVNDRLLDCSDAHNFSDASEKDRIGKCFTWIKADSTFKGLLQVLHEPDDRVFIGDIPPSLQKVQNNTTRYIKNIHIYKKPGGSINEIWFDNDIPLNTNLVAIIGNKGKGKSALTDIIGLLCNTRQQNNFTFLSPNNFRRSKDNKSKHFQATLTWESELKITKGLDESIDETKPELAKYIPQNFLEKICTQIGEIEESDFDRELKKVIFSHVNHSDRLGKENLDDLITYRTTEAKARIKALKDEMHSINERIVKLEDQKQPEFRQKLENLLSQKNNELEAHEKAKPKEVPKPGSDPTKQIQLDKAMEEVNKTKAKIAELEKEIELATKEQEKQAALISITENLLERLDNLDRRVKVFNEDSRDELQQIGLSIDDIVTFSIDRKPLQEKRQSFSETKQKADRELDQSLDGSLTNKKRIEETRLEQLKAKLDEPNRKFQEYETALKLWEKQRNAIIGNENAPKTRDYYQKQLVDLERVPARLKDASLQRLKKAMEIHKVIMQLVKTYRDLYAPVNNFINSSSLARDKFNLKFDVEIVDTGFESNFFEFINQRVSGTFSGVEEGHKMMERLLQKQDFNTETGVEEFLYEIINRLQNDQRTGKKDVRVTEQLCKGKNKLELYDMIFSLDYLKPRYALKLGDKELHQLSPGERGTLLLVFYLLVDKETIPLIIDQPEENLDNQTVYQLLVPCFKEAKQRRQILIVTHNPNLAVVCDAEQVIHADLDKKGNYRMQYLSGSIENPSINKAIVDILEGTMPAFDNRSSKYHKTT